MGRPIQIFCFYIYFIGRLTVKGRMGSLPIVMSHPIPNKNLGLSAIFKIIEVNTFVFQRTPESLNKHVIHPTPLAIHGDFDLIIFKNIGKLKARKLTSLVCIKDVWNAIAIYGFL